MVVITVDLVRKRAEHHDKQLAPLEEIALHQEGIDKIEFIGDWCPKLKILLMQSNVISKIENLKRLKELNYLNLALNLVEKVENLEGCESLQKLDLTLNFIGELTSIETLKDNYNLEHLYLTGNPCTDYEGYRDYVIATLPQLISLDGTDIERSERIKALQNLQAIKHDIFYEQQQYAHHRRAQKVRLTKEIQEKLENVDSSIDDAERNKTFWQEKCEHAPEVQREIQRHKEQQVKRENKVEEKDARRRPMFAADGRPYNINQAHIPFKFSADERTHYILDLSVYKHMDTSLMEVDVQPTYVRVTLKGKIFQLCLPEEIDVSRSTAQRSQTTGHLEIFMPKPGAVLQSAEMSKDEKMSKCEKRPMEKEEPHYYGQSKREYLEIGSVSPEVLDFTTMCLPHGKRRSRNNFLTVSKGVKEVSPDFVDNPDVPQLV